MLRNLKKNKTNKQSTGPLVETNLRLPVVDGCQNSFPFGLIPRLHSPPSLIPLPPEGSFPIVSLGNRFFGLLLPLIHPPPEACHNSLLISLFSCRIRRQAARWDRALRNLLLDVNPFGRLRAKDRGRGRILCAAVGLRAERDIEEDGNLTLKLCKKESRAVADSQGRSR